MVPCYHTLLNYNSFKFLATLAHPLFSSVKFNDIANLAKLKLLNGTARTKQTFLLAIWMLRAGLSCDPKSELADSLVENHMATLYHIYEAPNQSISSNPNASSLDMRLPTAYDITNQSNPCLTMGARVIIRDQFSQFYNRRPETNSSELATPAQFFTQLDRKLNSLVINRGKLGEAISSLLTVLTIDRIDKNAATTMASLVNVQMMKDLTPAKFHSLWDTRNCILADDETEGSSSFDHYKVVTVESFLERLLGKDELELMRPMLSAVALGGLVNMSHFVPLSRLSDKLRKVEGVKEAANANDLVPDTKRNVITEELLRTCMARQCGLLLPANYFALDAIIPVLLPIEFVTDPDGKESIRPVNPKVPNGVPEAVYQEDPIKHQGKSRYRPIYSFLGLQFKAGGFEASDLPGMQARLHFVPCPGHNSDRVAGCAQCKLEVESGQLEKPQLENGQQLQANSSHSRQRDLGSSTDRTCPRRAKNEALEQIFQHPITLLYSFKERQQVGDHSILVNYGRRHGAVESSSPLDDSSFVAGFLEKLYPDADRLIIDSLKAKIGKHFTKQKKKYRSFEDYYIKHAFMASEAVDLVSFYWDEGVGSTYRRQDLDKYKRAEVEQTQQGAIHPAEVSSVRHSSPAPSLSDKKKTRKVDPPKPKPIALQPPYHRARMSTIIIYGWSKWKDLIGNDGIAAADKLINEFDIDPVQNVDVEDVGPLSRSLKIIMSPRLLGLDQYSGAGAGSEVGKKPLKEDMPNEQTNKVSGNVKTNPKFENVQEYNNWVEYLAIKANAAYCKKSQK